MKKLEKPIENRILKYLSYLKDGYFWKNNSTGIWDEKKGCYRKANNPYIIKGVSDILGIFRGRFMAMEVKSPDNKARPKEQVDFINKINALGGKAGFVTSVVEANQLIEEVKREEEV